MPPHNHDLEEINNIGEKITEVVDTYLDATLDGKIDAKIDQKLDGKVEEKVTEYLDENLDDKIGGYLDDNLEGRVNDLMNVDRIINKGVLELLSYTSVRLTNARWVSNRVERTYTGILTIPAKPSSPNYREDIISYGDNPMPSVTSGPASPDPIKPNPPTGFMLAHSIFRTYEGPDMVISEDSAPFTKVVWGKYQQYAPIWRQKLLPNTYYGFALDFLSWASDYSYEDGQHPTNGRLFVNFDTKLTETVIDPERVAIRTKDMSVRNGEFVLVQTGADEATLFTKKRSFLGNMLFDFAGKMRTTTVLSNSLLRNNDYGALPNGDKYESYNGEDDVHSDQYPVLFDLPRVYGFDEPMTGNIAFPANIADANNPTRASTAVTAKVLHRASGEPTITQPQGITLVKERGTYVPNENNLYRFNCHKRSDGRVFMITYTIG